MRACLTEEGPSILGVLLHNVNSAFILINCLISQGCQSGSISQVQVVQVVRVVRVVRGSFGQVVRGSDGQVFRCSVVRW